MTHAMKLSDPWFSYVKFGKKTIECRVYDDKRRKFNLGDSILFTNLNGDNGFVKKITGLRLFSNLDTAIRQAKLKYLLPGFKTYKQGINYYQTIPGYLDKLKIYGIILIYLE